MKHKAFYLPVKALCFIFGDGNAANYCEKNLTIRNPFWENKNGKQDNFSLIICISLIVAPTNL